jgi:hypothetical protein
MLNIIGISHLARVDNPDAYGREYLPGGAPNIREERTQQGCPGAALQEYRINGRHRNPAKSFNSRNSRLLYNYGLPAGGRNGNF